MLRPSRRGAHGARADRGGRGAGGDPLPGLDQLHDVGGRGPRPGGVAWSSPTRSPCTRSSTALARLKMRWMIPPPAAGARLPEPAVGGDGRAVGRCPRLISAAGSSSPTASATTRSASWRASPTAPASPTLWRHENLNRATHEWLRDEFADVPLTFFEQILRCVEAGHLVSVDDRPELPRDFVDQPPQTDARFAFFAGELNACFEPESQRRTHAWFERHDPGRHTAPRRCPATATSTSSWARTPRATSSRHRSRAGKDRGDEDPGASTPPQAGPHALVDGIPFTLPVDSAATRRR